MTFVVTRPPASRQILAATLSKAHPRLPSTRPARTLRGGGHRSLVGGHTGRESRGSKRVTQTSGARGEGHSRPWPVLGPQGCLGTVWQPVQQCSFDIFLDPGRSFMLPLPGSNVSGARGKHPIPEGMLRPSFVSSRRKEGPPSIWDTHGFSGNVCANPDAVTISTLSSRIASMEFIDRRAGPFVHSGEK